jgi:hypothetical protein
MFEQPITVRQSIKNFWISIVCIFASVFLVVSGASLRAADETLSAGFLVDEFDLTLEPGQRTEAAGPFYYSEKKLDDSTLAIPPLISFYNNATLHSGEIDFLYPLFSYEHYTDEWRFQLFELLAFAGGAQPDQFQTKRFTLFPIYFQQRSQNTNLEYTACFPFYGRVKNRLFRDDIFCVLFPIFSETRKRDVVTDNYLYPIGHIRHGDKLHGWQVWPFVGNEHKDVTTQTNGFGDITTIGGHENSFVLWPFWISQDDGLGTANPEKFRASIPLFSLTRSPNRDATSVFWPLFTVVDEREKKYHEWEGPWPFVIFARGEGKTTDRVWPIFSQSHNQTQESDSYAWPLYYYKRTHSEPLDWQASRVFFYLYVGVTERNTETGAERLRRDAWPFFAWRKEFNGSTRLQILAPIESILANSRGIERNWSPIWSLWRAEENPRAARSSRSLLWNLYRRDTEPDHEKVSCLFGLYQREMDGKKNRTRLFYIPLAKP